MNLKYQNQGLGRDDDFLCIFFKFRGVNDDGTMKGNKTQGGFGWYSLIFIKSGSESPDVWSKISVHCYKMIWWGS